jgi:hypothetical protein
MSSRQADHSVRWLATIQLKNTVTRHWRQRADSRHTPSLACLQRLFYCIWWSPGTLLSLRCLAGEASRTARRRTCAASCSRSLTRTTRRRAYYPTFAGYNALHSVPAGLTCMILVHQALQA